MNRRRFLSAVLGVASLPVFGWRGESLVARLEPFSFVRAIAACREGWGDEYLSQYMPDPPDVIEETLILRVDADQLESYV